VAKGAPGCERRVVEARVLAMATVDGVGIYRPWAA
jgi:hypothetical protein